MRRALIPVSLFFCSLFLCSPSVPGQNKKEDKKDTPRIVVTVPLGIPAGTKTTIKVHGLRLDTATEVRFFEPKVIAKLLKKAKTPLTNQQDPNKLGDSLVEVEVTLPPEMSLADVSFVVVTPTGESPTHKLLVNGDPAPVAEKEPNNGFRQAQPIAVPQLIEGAINPAQDVDVFKFEGKEGQKLACEVWAARHGSPLDSILTLYNSSGQIIAVNDDFGDSTDSRLEVVLPKSGTYYLSLADAHDQGGPQYVYRLAIELK
jgi:hypothetical protein